MWVYHWHYGFSHGHFTETTTIGVGWYIVMFGLVVVVFCAQTVPAIRSYRRSKRGRQNRRRNL